MPVALYCMAWSRREWTKGSSQLKAALAVGLAIGACLYLVTGLWFDIAYWCLGRFAADRVAGRARVVTSAAVAVLVFGALGASGSTTPKATDPTTQPIQQLAGRPNHDAPAGFLTIQAPRSEAVVRNGTVTISGTAPAGARVVRDVPMALDQSVTADAAGHWSMDVDLAEGVNNLTFRIGDDRETEQHLTITFVPPTPSPTPVPTATPTPTATPPATPSPSPTPSVTPTVETTDTPDPTELPVKITSLPARVAHGANATVVAVTTRGATCSVEVVYASGTVSEAAGLAPEKIANSTGKVSWKWMVGTRTKPGVSTATVTCWLGDRYGSASRDFRVT